jgi:ATP-dependent RNA helicase DeaD
MTPKLFSELGLSPEVLKAIDRLGFEQASPIQAEAIPILMAGHDVVGQSQTGSGKTVAFGVPAVEKVDPLKRVVQVLILCPTRELAVQVSEEIHKLVAFKRGIHALPIYGGQSYERQYMGLRAGAQIVIGTPGRVMDHMRRGTLRLDQLKMIILDEADVMLNMGFREDIETILKAVPKERQTVFFCATMPGPIRQLIESYSREPKNVRIQQKTLTVPTVEQSYFEVDRRYKIELLTRLIDLHDLRLGIIFCNTKAMVDDLVEHLEAQGYSADRLHGDMTQGLRDRVMNKFRKSGLEFLVATDVAARGIDVDDVQVVFNYDLPYDVEDYVHRIGRTGRAGRSGRAISFVSGRELFQIRNIERYTNTRIPRSRIPTRDEVEEARANVFLDKLRATLQSGEFKRQDHLIERLLEEGFTSTDIASVLLHYLQGGEAAAKTPAEETAARPERPPVPAARPTPAPPPPFGARDDRSSAPSPGLLRRTERPVPQSSTAPTRPVAPARPAMAPRSPAPDRAESNVPSAAPKPKSVVPGQRVLPSGIIVTGPPAKYTPAPTKPRPSAPTVIVKKAAPGFVPLATPKPKVASRPKVPAAMVEAAAPVSLPPVASPAVTPTVPAMAPAPAVAPPVSEPAAPAPKVQDLPTLHSERPPEASASEPTEHTRLHMNIGEVAGVVPADIFAVISGETGLPAQVVSKVDIRERHLFVEVASTYANGIIAKLNRAQLKGRKLKVKVA